MNKHFQIQRFLPSIDAHHHRLPSAFTLHPLTNPPGCKCWKAVHIGGHHSGHIGTDLSATTLALLCAAFFAFFFRLAESHSKPPTSCSMLAVNTFAVSDTFDETIQAESLYSQMKPTKILHMIFRDYSFGEIQWQHIWTDQGCECRLQSLPTGLPEDMLKLVGTGPNLKAATASLAEQLVSFLPPPLERVMMGKVYLLPRIYVIRTPQDWCPMLEEAMECRWVAVDSECTQVQPPLLVQVATHRAAYVFVATDKTGVKDPRLVKLFAMRSVVKAVFGREEYETLCSVGPVFNWVNLQSYWQAVGLKKRRDSHGLGDFASALAGKLVLKDECGEMLGDIGRLALRNEAMAQEEVAHQLAALPARVLRYAATDAWVTKAIYEHLLRTGFLLQKRTRVRPITASRADSMLNQN
jgi:hypothetical protein